MTALSLYRIRELRREIGVLFAHGTVGIDFLEARALLDMAERDAERIEELEKRRSTYRICTGPDATEKSCPVHGDCSCKPEPGDFYGDDTTGCPLHDVLSFHAVPPFEGMGDETGSGK